MFFIHKYIREIFILCGVHQPILLSGIGLGALCDVFSRCPAFIFDARDETL